MSTRAGTLPEMHEQFPKQRGDRCRTQVLSNTGGNPRNECAHTRWRRGGYCMHSAHGHDVDAPSNGRRCNRVYPSTFSESNCKRDRRSAFCTTASLALTAASAPVRPCVAGGWIRQRSPAYGTGTGTARRRRPHPAQKPSLFPELTQCGYIISIVILKKYDKYPVLVKSRFCMGRAHSHDVIASSLSRLATCLNDRSLIFALGGGALASRRSPSSAQFTTLLIHVAEAHCCALRASMLDPRSIPSRWRQGGLHYSLNKSRALARDQGDNRDVDSREGPLFRSQTVTSCVAGAGVSCVIG